MGTGNVLIARLVYGRDKGPWVRLLLPLAERRMPTTSCPKVSVTTTVEGVATAD
jgi:hypothetical protein